MDVALTGKGGRVISKTQEKKSEPVILRVDDGEAFIQIEISERRLEVHGDGGATRRSTWDLDLSLPRFNEK